MFNSLQYLLEQEEKTRKRGKNKGKKSNILHQITFFPSLKKNSCLATQKKKKKKIQLITRHLKFDQISGNNKYYVSPKTPTKTDNTQILIRQWMSEYPFKGEKKPRKNELVLTRNLFNEPSKYSHRKLHNSHRHIRKSSKTYATRAQTTQHSPVIQLISWRKK